jgi:hypothetical protein
MSFLDDPLVSILIINIYLGCYQRILLSNKLFLEFLERFR